MDRALRYQLLNAAAHQQIFLRSCFSSVKPEYFPNVEERIVAKAALKFYETYESPVGDLLRSEVQATAVKEKVNPETKGRIDALLLALKKKKSNKIPLKALEDRIKELHQTRFYEAAVDEIITAQEKGELSVDTLSELVERANRELSSGGVESKDFFAGIKTRILRRKFTGKKYPLLFIRPLDIKMRAAGRGHLAMFMASYNSGKGVALSHVALAYALQGLNVLYITLEDPKDVVEDRMDASLTGLVINELGNTPKRLEKLFRQKRDIMRGHIKIYDGTEGGWTVSRAEQTWMQEHQKGFTADAIIIDYDDELDCEKQFKGESTRRFEFAEIYRRLRRMAAKLNVILWTASQGNRETEGKRVVSGKDAAEDISKVRKTFLSIGIGTDPTNEKLRHLFVQRHRTDRSRFGVDIMTDMDRGIFYDADATKKLLKKKYKGKK